VKHQSILQNFTADPFCTGIPCQRYAPGLPGKNTFIFDTSNLILPDDEKALG
jgi:hypothetical protein